jgi:hypothetical protein
MLVLYPRLNTGAPVGLETSYSSVPVVESPSSETNSRVPVALERGSGL